MDKSNNFDQNTQIKNLKNRYNLPIQNSRTSFQW